MRPITIFVTAMSLVACTPPAPAPKTSPAVDVAALEAELGRDPKRLRQTLRRCHTEREVMGEVVCDAANRVQRQRFMGSGTTKYTPGGGSAAPTNE